MSIRPEQVSKIGLVGMGSVGAGWATAYLAHGCEVLAFDPTPGAEQAAHKFLQDTWGSVRKLGLAGTDAPPLENLRFLSVDELAREAEIVHENVPEDVRVKRETFKQLEAQTDRSTVICSSSGGLTPSELQAEMTAPERLVIAHPFNPAHLIPLVEVIGGRQTSPETVEWTMSLMRRIGKKPIKLEREMTAYLANRLQFALLREAVHCLAEGVADASSIDAAVRYALAPRWLIMGALMTFSLAGGPDGMPAVLEKFSASTEKWWDSLGAPRLTPDVRAKLIAAGDELAGQRPLDEWIVYRDRQLVELLAFMRDHEEQMI
jgi:3-hydroxyacyl-CoA dehydrogenase